MIIPHLKDDSAQARLVSIDLPASTVQSGEMATYTVQLLDLPDLKPGDMVTLTHLVVPRSLLLRCNLVGITVDDDIKVVTHDFLQSLDNSELGAPDHTVFPLIPVPISPLSKVKVLLRNIAPGEAVFEGQLVGEVKHVAAMWFGPKVPDTRFEWLREITRRATKAFFDWRRGRKLLKDQAKQEREDEEWDTEEDPEDQPHRERLREHLRLLAIDVVSVAAFPLKAALHLTTKSLDDMKALSRASKQQHPRSFVLNAGKTEVPSGGAANINVHCQVCFRPVQVVIPAKIAAKFLITDIKVGKNSQFLSATPIPATSLAYADGMAIPLKMDAARPGMFITLSVCNTSASTETFEATLIGIIEDWSDLA